MASHAFEHDDRRPFRDAGDGVHAIASVRPAAHSAAGSGAHSAACPATHRATRLAHRPPFALTFAFICALALAFILAASPTAAPAKAFADEGDQNLVDPTQRADNSFIYDTTIESLFDQSSLYENRTVQVVGEAIGDRITSTAAEGNCWITLTVTDSEDKSSISVLMSDEQANQIDHFGKYGVTGTILQVRGTYHQACGEHEGLPDIHATEVSVMARGVEHPDTFTLREFVPGVIAIGIGIVLMAVFYVARERTR